MFTSTIKASSRGNAGTPRLNETGDDLGRDASLVFKCCLYF